jgi:peptidoglycan/LPS O-acetylase OafA/YrhL
MKYSAPLDGVRAIAILAVLLFHVSPRMLRGGFTGVDVFFVLSGFLITSIILHDVREGRFSLREFYLRRIQRLLPNVVVTVLAVLVLWTAFMPPSAAVQAGRHGLWTICSLSNIYIWKYLGGYWGNAAEWSPLTHTWSLGVEEQFYLLFPGSLLLLAKFQPRRMRTWLMVAAAVSFGLCVYGTSTHPVSTFYLLPTRLWELLIGAVLAAHRTPLVAPLRTAQDKPDEARRELGVNTQEAIGLVGLAMIIWGFVFINDGSGFPGVVSLAPTLGAGLVLLSIADGKTMFARLLSTGPMVGTGKLSYSIYLWHWPLITLGKALADGYGMPRIYGAAAGAVAGVVLACVAYLCVEQPLRRRGTGRAWRFAVIGVTFSMAAVSAAVVTTRHPVADPARRFDPPAFFGEQYTAGDAAGANSATRSTRYYDVYFPPVAPTRAVDLWRSGGVVHLYGGGRPQVVVLGSSHALMYSKLIDDICRERGVSVAFLAVDAGTAFFASTVNWNFSSAAEASEFDEARKKWLREWQPKAVFVIDRWDERIETPQGFDRELRQFIAEVGATAGRVFFVSQVPAVRDGDEANLRELVTWRMKTQKELPRLEPDQKEALRKQALAIAEAATANFPKLRVLRADLPFYNEDGSIRYEAGRAFLYADGDHLTESGAEVVRGLFEDAITEAVGGSSGAAAANRLGAE